MTLTKGKLPGPDHAGPDHAGPDHIGPEVNTKRQLREKELLLNLKAALLKQKQEELETQKSVATVVPFTMEAMAGSN